MTRTNDLERALKGLADAIDWPEPSPYLASRVLGRIDTVVHRSPRLRRLALALVMSVLVLLVFSPPARQAVADLLGAAGIEISVSEDPILSVADELDLGDPISLQQVSEEVGFDVRSPSGGSPGEPDGVFLTEDGWVNMMWTEVPGLAIGPNEEAVLIFSQFEGPNATPAAVKSVTPDSTIAAVTVEGESGRWIEGAPHSLTFFDSEGNPLEETTRLAANVLLWERGGVNHRLETTGDLASALEIVETLDPVG